MGLLDLRHPEVMGVAQNAKDRQEPHHDANHRDGVENIFDLSIHRNAGVDQPEDHPDDDESDEQRD